MAKNLKDLISSAMVEEQLKQQAAADLEMQRKQFELEQFEQAIARLLPNIYPQLEERRPFYLSGDEQSEGIAFRYEDHTFKIAWFRSRSGNYSHLQVEYHTPTSHVGHMFAETYHDDPREAERRFVVGLGNLMADLQTTPHELTRLPAPTLDDDNDDEAPGGAWRISELYTAAWLAFFAPSGWRAYAAAIHLHSVLRSVYGDLYEDRGAFTHWDPMHGPSDDQYREIAQRHGLPTDDGEVA